MTTLQMTFVLSAPACRALQRLASPRQLEWLAERFYDALQNERYREFALPPVYYTTAHGYRKALSSRSVQQGELRRRYHVTLTLKTFRFMKKLEQRGHSLGWIMEEILYFGFLRGMLEGLEA